MHVMSMGIISLCKFKVLNELMSIEYSMCGDQDPREVAAFFVVHFISNPGEEPREFDVKF